MPSPACPRTPSPSARPDRQLRLEKTTFPPVGSPNKERTHGTAVRSQPLSPGGGGGQQAELCAPKRCAAPRAQPPVPGPDPSPKSANPGPKSTDPIAWFQTREPCCLALIPVAPQYQPHIRSPSAAAPLPLPGPAPHPARPNTRCPARASVPVSPRPRQHSCPAPLSARISTGATSNVPSLLQPHVPLHPSAPGRGQRAGMGLSRGTGAQQGDGALQPTQPRGCPALGGHGWVSPRAGAILSPPSAARPHAWHSPVPSWGPLNKLPGSGQNSFPSKLLPRPQILLTLRLLSSSESGSLA